jgi:hypothetical protein
MQHVLAVRPSSEEYTKESETLGKDAFTVQEQVYNVEEIKHSFYLHCLIEAINVLI